MTQFKKTLFKHFAAVAKAMANPNRMEILELLSQCEYSVEELANRTGLSVANTSHHLQQLRGTGLLISRKEAQRVFYGLSGGDVLTLMKSIQTVAENHIEQVDELISDYLLSKDELEPVSRNELLNRVEEGSVIVLDVRPAMEYQAGHLPTAINLTVEELKQRFADLSPDQEIVAYCRGPHCILSFEAVEFLRLKGFKVRRLEEGFPEWRSAGLPIHS